MLSSTKEVSRGFLFAIPAIVLLVLDSLWFSVQALVVAFRPNTGLEGLVILYIPLVLGVCCLYIFLLYGLLQRNVYAAISGIFLIPALYYFHASSFLALDPNSTSSYSTILTNSEYAFFIVTFLSIAVYILECRDNIQRKNQLKKEPFTTETL